MRTPTTAIGDSEESGYEEANAGGTGSFGDRGGSYMDDSSDANDDDSGGSDYEDANAGGTGSFGDREDSYMEESSHNSVIGDNTDSGSSGIESPTTSCPDGMEYSERYGCYDPDQVSSGRPAAGSTNTSDSSDSTGSDNGDDSSSSSGIDTPTTSCPPGMSYSERYGCYDPNLVDSGTPGAGSTDSSEDSTDSTTSDSGTDTSTDSGGDSTDSTTDSNSDSDSTMNTPDGDTIEITTYSDGEAVDTIDTGIERPDDADETFDNRRNADPTLAESGVAGGGDLAVEFISAMAGEPGEGDDGDAHHSKTPEPPSFPHDGTHGTWANGDDSDYINRYYDDTVSLLSGADYPQHVSAIEMKVYTYSNDSQNIEVTDQHGRTATVSASAPVDQSTTSWEIKNVALSGISDVTWNVNTNNGCRLYEVYFMPFDSYVKGT